jgi:hypothetical protein
LGMSVIVVVAAVAYFEESMNGASKIPWRTPTTMQPLTLTNA